MTDHVPTNPDDRPDGQDLDEVLAEAESYLGSIAACQLAGISYRQLDYWTTRRLLTAVDDQNPGSGISRMWPRYEIEVAATVNELSEFGMSLESAFRIARRFHGKQPAAAAVVYAVRAYLERNEGSIQ